MYTLYCFLSLFFFLNSCVYYQIYHFQNKGLDFLKLQPLECACNMGDVAKVVTFDMASPMTGTCLPVDRGLLITPPDLSIDEKILIIEDLNPLPTQVTMETMVAAWEASVQNPDEMV